MSDNHDWAEYNNHLLNNEITIEEVMEALATLKQHKAMGFDGIPAEAIKNDLTCRFLGKLFNLCYLKACSPKEWNDCP